MKKEISDLTNKVYLKDRQLTEAMDTIAFQK